MRPARPLLLCALLIAIGCSQETPSAVATAEVPAAEPAVAAEPADVVSEPAAMPQYTLDLLDAVLLEEDTLESARERLGADNVVAEQIPGAEGETLAGWVVYPNDPPRRFSVYLDDAGVHPVMLMVGAEAVDWHRGDGVYIGMDSNQLAVLNDSPFDFFGFDWDYGGTIVKWRGGRIAPAGGAAGPVRLCPPAFADDYPEGYPVGDGEFASDAAVVVANPPRVCEYGLVLDSYPGQAGPN